MSPPPLNLGTSLAWCPHGDGDVPTKLVSSWGFSHPQRAGILMGMPLSLLIQHPHRNADVPTKWVFL